MSRIHWTIQEADGDAVTGVTVTVHKQSDDSLLGTMTGVGDGSYYYDLATSQLVKIKENGTVKLQNYWHAAEDASIATALAAQTHDGRGAHLIGVAAPPLGTANYGLVANELDDLLHEYYATYLILGDQQGAGKIGILDAGGFYSTGTVEDALQDLGEIFALLAGLTSTGAELNKLHGAGSNVTAANLDELTGGAATDLHLHDSSTFVDYRVGNSQPLVVGTYDFTVFSGLNSALDSRGNLILDVYGSVDGTVSIKRTHPTLGTSTNFEVVDAWKVGALNFSGDALLSGITGPGIVDECLKTISRNVRTLQVNAGVNYAIFDSGGADATAADAATAADPRATTKFYDKSASYVRKKRWALVQLPEHKTIELDGFFKGDSAGTSHVKLVCGSVEQEYKIPATSYGQTTLSISLATLPVTIPTARDVEIWVKGDGSAGGYMAQWFQLRVTI